jgi:hypothetical protein
MPSVAAWPSSCLAIRGPLKIWRTWKNSKRMDSIDPNSDTFIDATDLKRASRGESIDISPEAISRRFEILHELNELCAWLSQAKDVGAAEAPKQQRSESRRRHEQ